MTRRLPQIRRSGGFTLVEAILTIVIIGIVAGMVAVFIRVPFLSYRDALDRAELTDQADLALRRMARDIRLALPNSVRVSAAGDHLELLQTRSGARYLSLEDGAAATDILSFDDPADNTFAALAPPSSFAQVRVGDYVVVYNLGPGVEPANAYALADTGVNPATPCSGAVNGAGNIACITGIGSVTDETIAGQSFPVWRITLVGNPFARQEIAMSSPQQRFQVISGPVSFYCAANSDGRLALWRIWNYPISKTQTVPAGGDRALVATGLTTCNNLFAYGTAASQRTGLVRIALELRGRANNPATVRLVHQVHVDNTP